MARDAATGESFGTRIELNTARGDLAEAEKQRAIVENRIIMIEE